MSDQLLKSAKASGLYHLAPARHAAIEAEAGRARFCLLKAEIAPDTSIEEVLRQLGNALGFPIWYGANFDALFDCLTDSDWQPAKGHVLLINGMARLRVADPDDFTTLVEVFQAAVEARRDKDAPFWIVIDTPARGVPPLPEA